MKADLVAYDARHRAECSRCFRPQSECFCHTLATLTPRTQVLLLQHPRERTVAIGTARMTHLALTNSVLRSGVAFATDPIVQRALASRETALLFPAEDVPGLEPTAPIEGTGPADDKHRSNNDVDGWKDAPPKTLIVIDGTWSQARKILKENPALLQLPRVGLRPSTPGNYRIRREPNDAFLSTVEAVCQTLVVWEGPAFNALLHPFQFLVDRQVAAMGKHRNVRNRQRTPTKAPARLVELHPILMGRKRAVTVYVEANRHPRHSRPPGAPELVHLVASRSLAPRSDELGSPALNMVVKPRRPVADDLEERLGLAPGALESGVSVEEARAAFAAFFDPVRDVLCLWGQNARDVLKLDHFPVKGFVDVRSLAARTLGRRVGRLEETRATLCGAPPHAFGHRPRTECDEEAVREILHHLLGRAAANRVANNREKA